MNRKNCLSNTMFELLTTYNIEKITIDMILCKSQVLRATFYRYFRDKYDLMNWHHESFFQHLNDSVNETSDWKDISLLINTFISENRLYYLNAFKSSGQNSCLDRFHDQAVQFLKTSIN